jgi:hypothetical protein
MHDPYDRIRKQGKDRGGSVPNPCPGQSLAPEVDPILALRGVGKELWRELGGGEKFIRELRADWYGAKAPTQKSSARRKRVR